MKKGYAKSLPEYDNVEFDEEKVRKHGRIGRKMPTSVSLPPEVVEELKSLAEEKVFKQFLLNSHSFSKYTPRDFMQVCIRSNHF